jgi:hypothetical protein
LLAHDRWFFPGTPASSTTKTGRHDIAEILLKVALSTKNQIKSNHKYNIVLLFIPCVTFGSLCLYIVGLILFAHVAKQARIDPLADNQNNPVGILHWRRLPGDGCR